MTLRNSATLDGHISAPVEVRPEVEYHFPREALEVCLGTLFGEIHPILSDKIGKYGKVLSVIAFLVTPLTGDFQVRKFGTSFLCTQTI